MEEVDESEANWLAGLGAELANDLLGKTTPLFFSPDTAQSEHTAPCDSTINKLISTVYSSPTISEIENALSLSFQSGESYGRKSSRSIISLPEKGIGKKESKYTLRIKSCKSGLADDGYKWRKYGQKSIKNSPNPRSYYRCTNPRCNAKKQVERSMEDPETFIVSYEGLHLHYTYSHFLLSQPQDSLSTAGLHMQKKSKIQATNPEGLDMETKTQSPTTKKQEQQQNEMVGQENKQEGFLKDFTAEGPVIGEERLQHVLMFEEEQSPQGLLEDVVPLLVRKPCSSTTSSNELSSSYSQSSSPSYSSSLSWPPTNCYLDVDILSSIILETSW